jgi:uncharacterized protein
MLLVKTKLGTSNIQGIGLFADQFIKKGGIVWRYDYLIDRLYHINNFVGYLKDTFHKYSWRIGNYIIVPGDDARFINHSNSPNCIEGDKCRYLEMTKDTIAAKDIEPGEEITENYSVFDDDFDKYKDDLK